MAGQSKDGSCIVDIFESENAVTRFKEAIGTISKEAGIEEPPEFFPAHAFITTQVIDSGALEASFASGFAFSCRARPLVIPSAREADGI
jgi:hypothetical protein